MEYPAQEKNLRQQSINALLLLIIVYLTLNHFSTLSTTPYHILDIQLVSRTHVIACQGYHVLFHVVLDIS